MANLTARPYTLIAGREVGQASMAQVLKTPGGPVLDPHLRDRHQVENLMANAEDYSYLQLIIDSLPKELSHEERTEVIQFMRD